MASATRNRRPDRKFVVRGQDMPGTSVRRNLHTIDQHQMNQFRRKMEAVDHRLRGGAIGNIQRHFIASAFPAVHFEWQVIAEHGIQFEGNAHRANFRLSTQRVS